MLGFPCFTTTRSSTSVDTTEALPACEMHIRFLGLGILHLAASAAAETSGTFLVPWSTDRDPKAVYGHDGPWPAIEVPMGETVMPMLPDPRYKTLVTGKAAGGSYDPGLSRNAVPFAGYTPQPSDFIPSYFFNGSFEGQGFFEVLDLPVGPAATTADRPTTHISHNATIAVATHWSNNKTQPPEVGVLGLGKINQPPMPDGKPALGLLEAMHRNHTIDSNTYSLHLGSAMLGQRGSLVLGGYDPQRIVGDVGLFWKVPNAWLVDVQLGVAGLGTSPFSDTGNGGGGDGGGPHGTVSVFRGDGGNSRAETVRSALNGPRGAVYALLDSSLSSLYLPPGTCEAAASRLPVRWHAGLERYLWDTADPRYGRLIASPAYLALVLHTGSTPGTNVTIKVPFALLNLTLSTPDGGSGKSESLAYFPCQPFDSPHGVWLLGRAFLQAAFVLFDLDESVMWVAQAPGPDMTALGGTDGLTTAYVPRAPDAEGPPPVPPNRAPPYAWERSWAKTWTAVPVVLPLGDATTLDRDHADAGSSGESLSDGAKAGVAVAAAVAAIGVATTGGVLLWRRRRHVADRQGLTDLDDDGHPVYYEMAAGRAHARPRESKGVESLAELSGIPRPQELNGESQKKAW